MSFRHARANAPGRKVISSLPMNLVPSKKKLDPPAGAASLRTHRNAAIGTSLIRRVEDSALDRIRSWRRDSNPQLSRFKKPVLCPLSYSTVQSGFRSRLGNAQGDSPGTPPVPIDRQLHLPNPGQPPRRANFDKQSFRAARYSRAKQSGPGGFEPPGPRAFPISMHDSYAGGALLSMP